MADEEQQEAASASGDEGKAAAAPAKAPSGASTVLVIAVGLAVMIITPVLSLLGNRLMMPKSLENELEAPDPSKQEIFAMDEIRVNILGTKATRYVVMKPHLVLSDPSLRSDVEALKPKLADRISTAISRRTLDELEGPEGRVGLRRDIMNEVNEAIRGLMKGAVVDVYLVDFLIQ